MLRPIGLLAQGAELWGIIVGIPQNIAHVRGRESTAIQAVDDFVRFRDDCIRVRTRAVSVW